MNFGAIGNFLSPANASPQASADKGFSLDLAKATATAPDAGIASLPEDMSRSGMEAFCINAFNQLVRDVNELLDLLARQDPSLEAKLDDLDLRINTLITFCGDILPQSAMDQLRGMRELVDAMRGALGFNADQSQNVNFPNVNWSRAGELAGTLWEGMQRLAPLLGGGPGRQHQF